MEKAKSNSVVTAGAVNGVLEFNVLGVGKLTFDPHLAAGAMRQRAEMHGWEQRIRDAAAIARDKDTGRSATPQEKYDAMAKLVAHYESGAVEWNVRAQRVAKATKLDDVREALARLGIDAAKIGGLGDDKLRELAASKRVAEQMLEIERERLARGPGKADADGLLDELMDEGVEDDGDEPEEALV